MGRLICQQTHVWRATALQQQTPPCRIASLSDLFFACVCDLKVGLRELLNILSSLKLTFTLLSVIAESTIAS